MTQEQLQAIVQQALDSFGAGFATSKIESNLVNPASSSVVIRDKKGRVMGNVNTAGVIDRKYDGKKALMGALVRDKIAAAIKTGRSIGPENAPEERP